MEREQAALLKARLRKKVESEHDHHAKAREAPHKKSATAEQSDKTKVNRMPKKPKRPPGDQDVAANRNRQRRKARTEGNRRPNEKPKTREAKACANPAGKPWGDADTHTRPRERDSIHCEKQELTDDPQNAPWVISTHQSHARSRVQRSNARSKRKCAEATWS